MEILPDNEEEELRKRQEKRKFAIKAGLFLTGVTLVSAAAGFGTSISAVRKKEHEILAAAGFTEGKMSEVLAHEAGSRLAFRALGWGTLYAVTGVSLICYIGWKISGASNFDEFRAKMGKALPKIPKSANPGPNEFSTFDEFIAYISRPTPKTSDSS